MIKVATLRFQILEIRRHKGTECGTLRRSRCHWNRLFCRVLMNGCHDLKGRFSFLVRTQVQTKKWALSNPLIPVREDRTNPFGRMLAANVHEET